MEKIEKIENIARDYVAQAASMFAKGEAITSMLLSKKGHTSDNPFEFNTVHGMNVAMCAPSVVSTNSQGEFSYCYIVKIWVGEDDKIYCDLYDYDRAEDLECVNFFILLIYQISNNSSPFCFAIIT